MTFIIENRHDEIIEYITKLAYGELPENETVGMCPNVENKFNVIFKDHNFKDYPGRTADCYASFPVPHPTKRPLNAYLSGEGLWEGEYGCNRRKFCMWVVENIKPSWYRDGVK